MCEPFTNFIIERVVAVFSNDRVKGIIELRDKLNDKFNSYERKAFNILGLKRPFVLKVSGMNGRIPGDALPAEKTSLKTRYTMAYFYQKLQETYNEFAKLLAERLKDYKNNPGKRIDEVHYQECKSYEKLHKVYLDNKEFIDDCVVGIGEEILESMNEAVNREIEKASDDSSAKVKSEVVKFFNEQIDYAKSRSRVSRVAKQDHKDLFCMLAKQANYGIKLAKKYGELKYEPDSNGKPKSCEYNEKWFKHKDDQRITYVRREIIGKMTKPN